MNTPISSMSGDLQDEGVAAEELGAGRAWVASQNG